MTGLMRGASWVGGLLASGLLLYFSVATAPAREPTVADHLRYTSVHVVPGAEGELDVAGTRAAIGLRPIVVAEGDDVRCDDIVDALPDVIAIVLPGPDVCGGVDARAYDRSLAAEAEEAPDFVAAYVRAYDARFAGDPPRRDPPAAAEAPGPDARQVVTLAASALFAALFVLTAVFVIRIGVRDLREHEDRTRNWRARGDARLNRLADLVLRFDGAGGGETAKRYVLALREFEAAVTEKDRVAVDGRLTELERAVGVLPKKVVRPRRPAPKPVRRKKKPRWHGDVDDLRARRG